MADQDLQDLRNSAKLLAHQLASLSLDDIRELEKRELKPEELEAMTGAAELFYRSYFEEELRLMILEQLKLLAKEGETPLAIQFSRGAIYGLTLIRDWFEEETARSLGRFEPKEKPKPGEAIEKV